jgi:hypothetical protein
MLPLIWAKLRSQGGRDSSAAVFSHGGRDEYSHYCRFSYESEQKLIMSIRSITTDEFAKPVIRLREADRLCLIQEEKGPQEPQIICSLGLFTTEGNG